MNLPGPMTPHNQTGVAAGKSNARSTLFTGDTVPDFYFQDSTDNLGCLKDNNGNELTPDLLYGSAGAGVPINELSQYQLVPGPSGASDSVNFNVGDQFNQISTTVTGTVSAQSAASPFLIIPVTSGGITVNLEFVLADQPTTAFETDVEEAARILAADIHNRITVNIKVGYGEFKGSALPSGEAAAFPDGGRLVNYSSVRADLIANAATGDTNFNALPAGSSIQDQSQVEVWNAQLKAFSLLAPNDTTTDDGFAGFAKDIFDSEMVGVALHELTHAMGRVPNGAAPDIFDFTRFTSAGVRLFDGNMKTAPAAYFSVDGGTTRLADYGESNDPSDFLNPPSSTLTPEDPFNEFYNTGTIQGLTNVDLTQLDTLGFNTSGSSGRDDTPTETVPLSAIAALGVSTPLSGVSIADADAVSRGELFIVTLGAGSGNLSASNSGGATVSGSGTMNLTIFGTLAQVNVALGTLSYLGTSLLGDDISVTTTDGSDGSTTSTLDLSVTVNRHPAVNDFNNDGMSDLLWRNTSGVNAVWEMNGQTVKSFFSIPTVNPAYKLAGTGDFNGDHHLDLLWRNTSGVNAVWNMDGNGNIKSFFNLPSVDPSYKLATVGDFNADGTSDLLWRNTTTGVNAVWELNSSGNIGSFFNLPTVDPSYTLVGTGDFDGNGVTDLIWRNTSGVNAVWEMNADGSIKSFFNLPTVDPSYILAGTGDFNDDGVTDLLWRNTVTGVNAVWEMNPNGGIQSFFNIPTVDTSYHVEQIADFNGDGHADILWRNTSGVNAVWEMTSFGGLNRILSFFNIPTVDPSYQAVGTQHNVI
jgi:FG-GAP-like repeat